jgi:hypothetical protein
MKPQPPTSLPARELGAFEGFNFRQQAAIERTLTAAEVTAWNHDADGEAEFWPAGDHAGVALVFKDQSAVTARELQALAAVLDAAPWDATETCLRVHFAVRVQGAALEDLTAPHLEDQHLAVFFGGNFHDVRRDAAFELFETYYPELFRLWDACPMNGLRFDWDDFLDSPVWTVEEVTLGDRVAVLVAPA